jgi:hypothetical protein
MHWLGCYYKDRRTSSVLEEELDKAKFATDWLD